MQYVESIEIQGSSGERRNAIRENTATQRGPSYLIGDEERGTTPTRDYAASIRPHWLPVIESGATVRRAETSADSADDGASQRTRGI